MKTEFWAFLFSPLCWWLDDRLPPKNKNAKLRFKGRQSSSNPSNSPAMIYPDVKILKRIWLDAQQHAEKIRNVSPEDSYKHITQEDIQEAIDMLSESQRLRLRGIARLIPAKGN